MDIVLSKNDVKCAVLKISDVQKYFVDGNKISLRSIILKINNVKKHKLVHKTLVKQINIHTF